MKRVLFCLLLCVLIGASAYRMASYADEQETTMSEEEKKQQEALERAAYAREQAEILRRDLDALQVQADDLLEESRRLTSQIAENKSLWRNTRPQRKSWPNSGKPWPCAFSFTMSRNKAPSWIF